MLNVYAMEQQMRQRPAELMRLAEPPKQRDLAEAEAAHVPAPAVFPVRAPLLPLSWVLGLARVRRSLATR